MGKKNSNLAKNLANERQRFSIRKLSIGAASVFLGTAFFLGGNAQTTQAATPDDSATQTEKVEEVTPSDANSGEDRAVSNAKDSSQNQKVATSDAVEDSEIQDNPTDKQKQNVQHPSAQSIESNISEKAATTQTPDAAGSQNQNGGRRLLSIKVIL